MAAYKKRTDFFLTQEGQEFVKALKDMVADSAYSTGSTYNANSELYPDNQIPFVNKHMDFIRSHPMTDPQHYLANLRLMNRVR